MANDNNNNPFNLPRLSGDESTSQNTNQDMFNPPREVLDENPNAINMNMQPMPEMSKPAEEEKPIIEIPQKYYDILEDEKREKEKQEQEKQQAAQAQAEVNGHLGKIGTLVVTNAIVIFACMIAMVKVFELIIFAIPVFIIVMSFIHATKEGKESNYPISILIGGMAIAVITFVISMLDENNIDMWTHFAIISGITAFVGLIVSNIITKLLTNHGEVKALETLGYIFFFALLIGVPGFLYYKYPETVHRLLFQKITEVKAETEEEFVIKTLKNRYNLDFKCDGEIKSHIDFGNRLKKSRTCKSPDGVEVQVFSLAYNEGKNQYIIFDDYMDKLFFNKYTEKLENELKTANEAKEVKVYFYPEENCLFIGDCADTDEYRENIEKEEDINNQYKVSSSLDLSRYMKSYDAVKYINESKFKVVIKITISNNINAAANYNIAVDKTLDYLNNSGLKNNYGFDILIQSYDSTLDYVQEELRVNGKATSDKTFKDQVVVKDANNKNR